MLQAHHQPVSLINGINHFLTGHVAALFGQLFGESGNAVKGPYLAAHEHGLRHGEGASHGLVGVEAHGRFGYHGHLLEHRLTRFGVDKGFAVGTGNHIGCVCAGGGVEGKGGEHGVALQQVDLLRAEHVGKAEVEGRQIACLSGFVEITGLFYAAFAEAYGLVVSQGHTAA